MMVRIRWTDLVPDDPSSPAAWRYAALIIATIFLNFPFFVGFAGGFFMPCSLAPYIVLVVAASALLASLFFIGPAKAAQRSGGGLFGAMEESLGSWPTLAVRLCCAWYLLVWIGDLTASGVL